MRIMIGRHTGKMKQLEVRRQGYTLMYESSARSTGSGRIRYLERIAACRKRSHSVGRGIGSDWFVHTVVRAVEAFLDFGLELS